MRASNIRFLTYLLLAISSIISQTVLATDANDSILTVRNHRIMLHPTGEMESILLTDPINNHEAKMLTPIYKPISVDGADIFPETSPSKRSHAFRKELISILTKNTNLKQLPDGSVIVSLHYVVTTPTNQLIYADAARCHFKSSQSEPLRTLSSEAIISTEQIEAALKKLPKPSSNGYSLLSLNPAQIELRIHKGNITPLIP